ncbi:MAG: TPR domain protein [Nitrospira sp.]|jgi:tetratricopeptide (TPR) repeat protein|nr:MAG: TPR domain protein [Nitrospira sp.]
MYRRNIKHILGPLAVLIGLFIFYQTWLKPRYFHEPQSPAPPVIVEATPPASSAPVAPPQEPVAAETKRPRTIDPVSIPVPRHSELLSAIHEELEKHNVTLAQTKLEELPSSLLTESATKRHVAILWNNLGILQEKTGGTEVSMKAFKKAVSLDPQNPVAHLNLANAYWGLRDPALTEEFLRKVMTLVPDEPFPHVALADLLQERDQLTEAGKHLIQAKERIKKDPGLLSYLKVVTTKVQRAEKVEEKLSARNSIHFTVKYDGSDDPTTWTTVLDILEEAYREVGQKFNFFPSKPIIVVLHTKNQFQSATGSPNWADGLFDPVLGRIQIPTQGAATDRAWLTRVLRHEFVHALVHEELGTTGGAIPTWLNEGLAMQLAGDPWQELKGVLRGDHNLIPLTALEGSWENLSAEKVGLAYMEATTATHYLIERFGMHKVHEVLVHLKARQTIAAAMQDRLLLSYDHFQQQWADSLGATLAQPKS